MDTASIPLLFQTDADGALRPLDGVESIFLTASTCENFKLGNWMEGEKNREYIEVEKEQILSDIQFRGAISDFHPIKTKIQMADYGPLLLMFNGDDRYNDGNNFELAWKKEAADQWIGALEERRRTEERTAAKAATEEAETSVPRFKRTRIIKPSKSLGSEKKVEKETATTKLSGPCIIAWKKRSDDIPSAMYEHTFVKDSWNSEIMEYRPDASQGMTVKRMLKRSGIQAGHRKQDKAVQTRISESRCVNDITQYETRDLSEEEKRAIFISDPMKHFLQNTQRRLEEVFLQSHVVDVLQEEFVEDDGDWQMPTEKKDSVMKEHHSFTDLFYNKSRIITHIEWSPSEKGVFAVSCIDPMSSEARSQSNGKQQDHAILEWSIHNSMAPFRVMVSHSEITTFQYHPHRKHLLAAGTFNGQILIWTTEEKETSLGDSSVISHTYASSLEVLINAPITDLKWFPGYNISKTGDLIPTPVSDYACNVFMTCSSEGRLVFWDILFEKTTKRGQRQEKASKLQMNPVFSVSVFGKESEEVPLHRICFASKDRSQFLIGTLDGDVIRADFNRASESDHPEITDLVAHGHEGKVVAVEMSPLCPDVFLTVGGWTFKIWKSDELQPLIRSPNAKHLYTSGVWSPTRAGVVALGTQVGTVEIWDLLDRLTDPSLVTPICSIAISPLAFTPITPESEKINTRKHSIQFLAVGDHQGTVHMMHLPKSFNRPISRERHLFSNLLSHHLNFLQEAAARADQSRK